MTSLFSYFYDSLLIPLEKAGIQTFRKKLIMKGNGTILEVGCGTGLNFPYYQPGQVSHVYAIEPTSLEVHMKGLVILGSMIPSS